MRLLISTAIALTAALVAAGPAIDLMAAPKPRNPPVKITFADHTSHNITSDLGGSYENGQSGVVAYINKSSNGELVFYQNPTPGVSPRMLQLFFRECIGTCTGAPFPSGFTRVNIIAGIRAPNESPIAGGLLGMSVTPSGDYRTGLKINIPLDSDPAFWTLCMTPTNADGFCGISDHSTPARIVRDDFDHWTVTASAVDGTDVGELFRETGNGRNKIISLEGTYSMPFSFTVQCVNSNCS